MDRSCWFIFDFECSQLECVHYSLGCCNIREIFQEIWYSLGNHSLWLCLSFLFFRERCFTCNWQIEPFFPSIRLEIFFFSFIGFFFTFYRSKWTREHLFRLYWLAGNCYTLIVEHDLIDDSCIGNHVIWINVLYLFTISSPSNTQRHKQTHVGIMKRKFLDIFAAIWFNLSYRVYSILKYVLIETKLWNSRLWW